MKSWLFLIKTEKAGKKAHFQVVTGIFIAFCEILS